MKKANLCNLRFISIVAVPLLIGLPSAWSDIISFKASSTFAYLYEMDVAPNNQDQDSNGGDDWFDTNAPAVSGGFASIVNSGNNTQIFRGDFNDGAHASIWRAVAHSATASWTLELRVAKTGGNQGADGWFAIATANKGESNSSRLNIENDRISLTGGSDYFVGTNFSDGSYHTIRIAHDAIDNATYYWVNGTLLNTDLSTPLAGANGTTFNNATFIGDFSDSLAGDFSIDYIRLDTEASGPLVIPEPSSLSLLLSRAYVCVGFVESVTWLRVKK